ncbi:mitochondrial 50S ribosomal protein L28-like protein [Obba rivulosa]|uniref:Large ribosomal subunit protein bL28c n=1 Tax=Obba rivulosa TaxID=1052685 RepID=A0A8E2DHJ1_9APHY|nr:mitochondrial 50S ribosomal protein L28-like protein [Obba rivulosa]
MFPSLPSLMEAVSLPFKRSQLGLFHGKMKQYGNNVPFSKRKTRRSWLPNVQSKRLFSDALQEFVKVKVTTRALRTIKKHGGIDQYVLKTNPDLLGLEGMRIRTMVRDKLHPDAQPAVQVSA